MSVNIDLMNHRFAHLVVVERAGSTDEGRTLWRCKCDCGKETTVIGKHLRSGNTKSCGCLARQRMLDASTKHGDGKRGQRTTEYNAWKGMKRRCGCHSDSPDYSRYSGRGVRVCAGWLDDYPRFLADMGRKPAPKCSIERIDNEGNYSCGFCSECLANDWPMNCKWGNDLDQANNKCNNRRLTFGGRTLTVAEWARETGLKAPAIRTRILLGWSVKDALETPPEGRSRGTQITFDGRTQNMAQWAKEMKIGLTTLFARLKSGWSFQDALQTPPGSKAARQRV